MAYGKRPRYARPGSQKYWCERCGRHMYGQLVHRYEDVPGLPGADPNRIVEVGKTTQCDKCSHNTTRYIDD